MSRLILPNARLAFPNIFTARPSEDGGDPAFSGLFILTPDNPAVAALRKAFVEIAKEKWGAKADAILKQLLAQDRVALHDGANKANYDGFEGNFYVSARNKTRPAVFDRGRNPVSADSGIIYAGCFVNASIDLYAQDNKFGKRINATLRGVQFSADGDAFSGGRPATADEFEDLGDQGDVDPTA